MEYSKKLREIKKKETELEELRREADYIDRHCNHKFGDPEPDHIYHEGYTIPGDPPGTMGVDWCGPVHVPSHIEKRWKRECSRCGKIEHTSNTMAEVTEKPRW